MNFVGMDGLPLMQGYYALLYLCIYLFFSS